MMHWAPLLRTRAEGWTILVRLMVGLVVFLPEGIQKLAFPEILGSGRSPDEWQPRLPEHLDEEELADWRAGCNAVYQLAALTMPGPGGRFFWDYGMP